MFNKLRTLHSRKISLLTRVWSGSPVHWAGKEMEQKMINLLKNKFPKAKTIQVTDISGGCGAMFEVQVTAPEFQGLNTVQQHRLINQALKAEIKDMHGIRIHTCCPSETDD